MLTLAELCPVGPAQPRLHLTDQQALFPATSIFAVALNLRPEDAG